METVTAEQTAITDALWSAWIQKGRLDEEAEGRKMKVVAGVLLALLAGAGYVLLAK